MLSKIRPRYYQRYISLPLLGSILDEFTSWCLKHGYAVTTMGNKLRDSIRIDRFLRRHGAQSLRDLTHSSFETAWCYYRHRQRSIAGTVRQIERFLDETRGLAPLPPQPMTPTRSELNRFAEYLQDVRGLAATTIEFHDKYLQDFLEHIGYDTNTQALTKLTSKEIEDFLCSCAKRLNRSSLQQIAGCVRNFLRLQYDQGVLPNPLHTAIDMPRVYRLEKLPRSLPRETVEAFLHSIDRTNPHGIRDYAMFYLIATYGSRACEIVSLTLDDIDWRGRTLRVPQRKTKSELILPLTDAVGEVLLEYLKRGRPNLPHRELFLRVRAPDGPLKHTAVSGAFRHRVRRSGLDILYGPYCLRHSHAVHLLRQGTPTKAIGDLLGHRSAESTYGYLRLATEDLRSVALPVPRGPSVTTPLDIRASKPGRDVTGITKTRNPSAKVLVPLGSFLAKEIRDYLQIKRSLGRDYINEARALHLLDGFLQKRYPLLKDLTGEMFNQWCLILSHLSPTTKRQRMLHVRDFCLYRCRSRPRSFVPDSSTFPDCGQPVAPYIFSEPDIARLLSATQYLRVYEWGPLRSHTFRIAITLLYTTGLRRGEVLRLKLGDYNSAERVLFIRDTKFHKSRLIPLSPSVATELEQFLELRLKTNLPMDVASPLIWHGYGGHDGKAYNGPSFRRIWASLCAAAGIFTRRGRTPRVHDLRHSFAINVLQRWYQAGEDVQAKLPMLSTYMGHASIAATSYYLPFVEGIRSEASARFQQSFGCAITSVGTDD